MVTLNSYRSLDNGQIKYVDMNTAIPMKEKMVTFEFLVIFTLMLLDLNQITTFYLQALSEC